MKRLFSLGILLFVCNVLFCGTLAYADEPNQPEAIKIESDSGVSVNEDEFDTRLAPTPVVDADITEEPDSETISVGSDVDTYIGYGSEEQDSEEGSKTESNDSTESEDHEEAPVPSDFEKIEDGAYTIESALGTSLDVVGASQDDSANIQTHDRNYTVAQRYQVTASGQDVSGEWYYTITNINSGKVLDCVGGGIASRTNVQQYSYNGTGAQRWFLRKSTSNGETTYQVINTASGLALDVCGASPNAGANVQIYFVNGTIAQKWLLCKCFAIVEDGAYEIKSALPGSYVVDVAGGSPDNSSSLQIYGSNGTLAQSFALSYDVETGYYTITNYGSGKVADVEGGSIAQGTRLQQFSSNGTKAQKWQLVKDQNGSFIFVSALSGMAMDVRGAIAQDGTMLQQYAVNNTLAQYFFLRAVTPAFTEGTVTVRNGANENVVIDVIGGSTEEGSSIQLFLSNGTLAQKFRIIAQDDDSYTVSAIVSGLQMSVSCDGIVSMQNGGAEGFNQRWKIVATNDGHFTFVPAGSDYILGVSDLPQQNSAIIALSTQVRPAYTWNIYTVPLLNDGYYRFAFESNNGLVLDVVGGDLAPGTDIQVWQDNDSNAQKYYIKNLGKDVYSIQNAWSTLYLDIAGGLEASGTKVWQYNGNGTAAQRWHAQWDGRGGFIFLSSSKDFALGVSGNAIQAGNGICLVMADEAGANQRFVLTPAIMATLSMNDRISVLDYIAGNGLNVYKSLNGLSQQTINELHNAITSYESRGIPVGFMMMDLNTGDGVSYGIDCKYASASTIKGPYVAAINKYEPWQLNGWGNVMYDTIHYSSNEAYASLRNGIGPGPLIQLINETHAWGFDWQPYYVEYAPRDLMKLWVGMADYFLSNETNAWWCRDVFGSNESITSRPTLAWKNCPIYAKSGWIDSFEGEYTTVHNEGCLVLDGGNPYLMVVMSGQTHYESGYMSNLMSVLDRAHSEIIR